MLELVSRVNSEWALSKAKLDPNLLKKQLFLHWKLKADGLIYWMSEILGQCLQFSSLIEGFPTFYLATTLS